MTDFLKEFSALDGQEEVGCYEYAATVKAALSDMRTVLRPTTYDAVFVGNTEESRFDDVKAAFFIGCNDDAFPKKSGDGLIFSAFDNEAMRNNGAGITVYPSPVEKNALERFVVRDLLSKFSDRIYFGCSESGFDGTARSVSDGVKEIAFLIGDEDGKKMGKLIDSHVFSGTQRLAYRLFNEKNARYEYRSGRLSDEDAAVVKKWLKIEDEKKEEENYGAPFESDGRSKKISVSRLETYFTCPFRYFMQYGIRVEETEDATLKNNAVGTAIHNVLEYYFKDIVGEIDDLDEEKMKEKIESAVRKEFSKDDYRIYDNDPFSKYLLREIQTECRFILPALTENLRHSKFRPRDEHDFEVPFGYGAKSNTVELHARGETFRVVGKVDRVDHNGDDVIVIDYKTGQVKPELKNVRYGKKIQLYVYLRHYVDLGKKPAGVFYLPIKGSNVKGGRSYAMLGQMKKDAAVYRALDDRVDLVDTSTDKPSYSGKTVGINLYYLKGGWSFNSRAANVLSDEEFSAVLEYVKALSEQALCEILDGYAERKPSDSGDCERCPYRRTCGAVPIRKTESVQAPFFVKVMKGEESDEV